MSPRRRALVVAAAVALVAVVAATFALGRRAGPELTATAEVPVLLVPGYNGTPSSLGTLAARLRSAGREVVVVGLPDRGNSIPPTIPSWHSLTFPVSHWPPTDHQNQTHDRPRANISRRPPPRIDAAFEFGLQRVLDGVEALVRARAAGAR